MKVHVCLDSVTWYQHNGWYTRRNTEPNPTIYVGRNSHGSYDNSCGRGTLPWHEVGTYSTRQL